MRHFKFSVLINTQKIDENEKITYFYDTDHPQQT